MPAELPIGSDGDDIVELSQSDQNLSSTENQTVKDEVKKKNHKLATAVQKKDKKKEEDGPPVPLRSTYIFPNGDRYDGEYKHATDGSLERDGNGTHSTKDGTVYDGCWKDDKMNGKGRLCHQSGAVYEGDFSNNQFHGKGKYSWPNGSFYEGEFNENRMEGDGQFTDTEGQVWTGTFRYRAAPGLRFKLNLD